MVKKTGMLFAAFAACLLVGGVTAKGADGTILERTASKASLDEPPMTLPEGPVAKATVNGVTGREPKAGTGPFLDREYLLAEMRKYLKTDTVQSILVDMTPLGLVEITRKRTRKTVAEQMQELERSLKKASKNTEKNIDNDKELC